VTATEVIKNYIGRWSIQVFFKEAKPRLGLGQGQGQSFAARVFSVNQAFFRYSLLAYLPEQDDQARTIGNLFRQLEEGTGKLNFLERLWLYFFGLPENQVGCLAWLASNLWQLVLSHRRVFFPSLIRFSISARPL